MSNDSGNGESVFDDAETLGERPREGGSIKVRLLANGMLDIRAFTATAKYTGPTKKGVLLDKAEVGWLSDLLDRHLREVQIQAEASSQ